MASCSHVVEHWVLCLALLSVAPGNGEERKRSGRYTHDLLDYEELIPRKVDASGFLVSFDVPHFYDVEEVRARRSAPETQIHVRYALPFGGREYLVELWPNHGFLSPGFVSERRRRNLWGNNTAMNYASRKQCHFVGRVQGHPTSRAALSACKEGLAGYVKTDSGQYFVEPVADALPDVDGRHLHLVFRQDLKRNRSRRQDYGPPTCGVDDNWRAAWQNRFEWEMQTNPDFLMSIAKSRDTALAPRYLKTLVVVDKKFINYHRDHDAESYILTLMNEVSDYYHDGSLGRPLDVVIVRIIYLDKEEEELDLMIGPDAAKTMNSFRSWAQRVNPADTSHPNHHNIAVMITRYNICSGGSSNCNILGMSTVASVCQPERAACINEDSGLLTGITIAHEIGHILGCPHDKKLHDGDVGCEPFAPDGSAYVMSLFLKPRTSIWSECSRRCVQTLIDTGMADCLLDKPQFHPFKFTEMPPGVMYDADYQCRDLGSREVCPSKKDEMCNLLWCRTGPNACAAPGRPAADGTKCSEGHWCFGGECVMIGSRPAAVNGEWGAWSPWSSCSRSCGGGIQQSERFCDSPAPRNKGLYCIGERYRYQVCNHLACDPSAPSFREVQCAAFNSKPFEGELYEWTPFKELQGRECELLCYSGLDFFASLSPVAKDGTPCHPGTRDMCVAGDCMRVGCDWVLGSEVEEDICGECRGDGTHCHHNEILFDKSHGNRYEKIGTLPTGSRNIKIEELMPSMNTIAVANKNGTVFFLNGNYSEYSSGQFPFGKNVYGMYSHPESEREVLTIKGPTSEDLSVYAVFYEGENPGVRISFYEHRIDKKLRKPSFIWEFLEWGPCSARCGGGSQIAEASCVESMSGKVSSFYCKQSVRPKVRSRMCNQRKCFVGWHVGPWGPCSGRVWGLQRRKVECRAENPAWRGDPVLVDNMECAGVRPPDTRSCAKSVAKTFDSTTRLDSTLLTSKPTFATTTHLCSSRIVEINLSSSVDRRPTSHNTLSTANLKCSSPVGHYPSKVRLGVHRLTSSDQRRLRTSGITEHSTSKLLSTTGPASTVSKLRYIKPPEVQAAEHFWTSSFGIHEHITGSFDKFVSVSRPHSTSMHSKHSTTGHKKHKHTSNRRFKRSTPEQLKHTFGHHTHVTSRYQFLTPDRTTCLTTELSTVKFTTSTENSEEKNEYFENSVNEYNSPATLKNQDYATFDVSIDNDKVEYLSNHSDISSAKFIYDPFDFRISSTLLDTDMLIENGVVNRVQRADHMNVDTSRFSGYQNLYKTFLNQTTTPLEYDSRSASQQSEFAIDSLPESRMVLKEAPLIGTMCNKTLSEVAQQEMGDNLGDTLDTIHGKIYRGKEAVNREREIKKQQEREDSNNL